MTALTIADSSCVEGNGTYALVFTGGAVHVATGTYTILANVITAVVLTYGGEYYSSAPTVATVSADGSITATWADSGYRGEWAIGTIYYINQVVSVLSTQPTNHKLYIAIAATVPAGTVPGGAGNDLLWDADYSATDRWKVFDDRVGSQAQAAQPGDTITWELDPGPIDSVAILNLEAESVTVTMTDVGGPDELTPIIWTETTIDDGLFVSDIVKTDFPSTYSTPHLLIEIVYAAGTAKVGEIVVGLKESLGTLQYTPSVSIIDYSVKEVDDFGNYIIAERAYSKRLSCETIIENTILDATYATLATYRATAVVWVGSADYASMIVYGFYKDFSITIPYPKYSICTLEIEGLV